MDFDGTRCPGAERGIREHHVRQFFRALDERILTSDGTRFKTHAVQVHVHGTQRHDERCDVVSVQCLIAQKELLLFINRLILHVRKGREQKAPGAAGGIRDGFGDLGINDVHHGVNERPRSEVLTGAAFFILTVFLQDAFVECAFDVAFHQKPFFFINERDEFVEVGRAFNLVGSLREDGADEAFLNAQDFEGLLVAAHQFLTSDFQKIRPPKARRHGRSVPVDVDAFLIHLQKEKVGELREVVGEPHAGTGHDVRKTPDFFNERTFGFFVFSHGLRCFENEVGEGINVFVGGRRRP